MIWLAWRQHRKQALFTLAGLAVLAAFMIPTGLAMRGTFRKLGLVECVRQLGDGSMAPTNNEACNIAFNQFNNQYLAMAMVGILFLVLPLLVGLFWGAPLVSREVEQGTHRLVWTQGVSRRHWALVKIGLVGAVALVVAVAYGLGMSWWMTPLSQAGRLSRFQTLLFDMQGIAPIGYTLFAVALGILAGTVWPRVVPAMGATLAGFVLVRAATAVWARPRYMAADEFTYPTVEVTSGPNQNAGNWIMSYGIRDPRGKMIGPNSEIACPPNPTGPGANCGAALGIEPGSYNWVQFQPADRYWMFQTIETGVFVALAALLIYLAIRRVRRIA